MPWIFAFRWQGVFGLGSRCCGWIQIWCFDSNSRVVSKKKTQSSLACLLSLSPVTKFHQMIAFFTGYGAVSDCVWECSSEQTRKGQQFSFFHTVLRCQLSLMVREYEGSPNEIGLCPKKSGFLVMQTTENCTETTANKVKTDPAKITSYLDNTRNGCGSWFTQNFTFLSATQLVSPSVI